MKRLLPSASLAAAMACALALSACAAQPTEPAAASAEAAAPPRRRCPAAIAIRTAASRRPAIRGANKRSNASAPGNSRSRRASRIRRRRTSSSAGTLSRSDATWHDVIGTRCDAAPDTPIPRSYPQLSRFPRPSFRKPGHTKPHKNNGFFVCDTANEFGYITRPLPPRLRKTRRARPLSTQPEASSAQACRRPGRVVRHCDAGACLPAGSRSEGVLPDGFACANATACGVDPEFRIRVSGSPDPCFTAIDTRAGRQTDAFKLKKGSAVIKTLRVILSALALCVATSSAHAADTKKVDVLLVGGGIMARRSASGCTSFNLTGR